MDLVMKISDLLPNIVTCS